MLQHTINTFREAQRFPEGSRNQHLLAFRLILLLVGMVYLAACSNPMPTATPAAIAPTPEDVAVAATPEPTDSPTALPTDAPTEAATEAAESKTESTTVPTTEPTAVPTETPVPEPEDWTDTVTVEGDLFIRGNPAAPIRLVDYSDFM